MRKVKFVTAIVTFVLLVSTSTSVWATIKLPQFSLLDTASQLAFQSVDEGTVYEHPVLGVKLVDIGKYDVIEHQYLSEVYGFNLVRPTGEPVLSIGWRHKAAPDQMDKEIQDVLQKYPGLPTTRTQIEIDGKTGAMLVSMPGARYNVLIYVVANERLYEIRYWRQDVDDEGQALLRSIRFTAPTQSLESLQLLNADDVLFVHPPVEQEIVTGEPFNDEELSAPQPQKEVSYLVQPGCIDFPSWKFLRIPWDSNANGQGTSFAQGWSQAGPYYFGEGTHTLCNDDWHINDYYALDFSLKEWDCIYAPGSGTVLFVGWASGGWEELGREVIIDLGQSYWSLSAHLRGINVVTGQQVTTDTIIGFAGGSGSINDIHYEYLYGIHLHQGLYNVAQLDTTHGGIYDGQSAHPSKIHYYHNGGGDYWNVTRLQSMGW